MIGMTSLTSTTPRARSGTTGLPMGQPLVIRHRRSRWPVLSTAAQRFECGPPASVEGLHPGRAEQRLLAFPRRASAARQKVLDRRGRDSATGWRREHDDGRWTYVRTPRRDDFGAPVSSTTKVSYAANQSQPFVRGSRTTSMRASVSVLCVGVKAGALCDNGIGLILYQDLPKTRCFDAR